METNIVGSWQDYQQVDLGHGMQDQKDIAATARQ